MLAIRQSRMLIRAANQSVTRRSVGTLSSFYTVKPYRPIEGNAITHTFNKQRYYATTIDANSTPQQSNQRPPQTDQSAAPEMESSLDSIVPESIFTNSSLTRETGRKIVSTALQQLRDGLDAKSQEEVVEMEINSNNSIRNVLKESGLQSASPLHHFTVQLLKHSRDPRRLPIASRLFLIAFDRDPYTMPDPTVETVQQGSPLFTANQWGVNAAGYNWASMVLSGQALPPSGLHLMKRGSEEQKDAIKDQQAAAIRVYATLATIGDTQGMLGMGRILLASAHKTESKDQAEKLRERAIVLWTKAGEKGLAEAWYELGILSMNDTQTQAQSYFEKGAKMDDIRCNHALGILLTQKAMQINLTPSPPERKQFLDQSFDHFKKAAEMGDGQSAHQVGMRFLLRQEMIDEIGLGSDADRGAIDGDGRTTDEVRQQASNRHLEVWGVQPDDVKAREWFTKGADVGFMPAMMNLAGMLFEARGVNTTATNEERIKELRKAESLYAKVAAQAGVMAQQQQQQQATSTTNTDNDPSANLTAEMTMLAQDGLGKVQDELRSLVEVMEK